MPIPRREDVERILQINDRDLKLRDAIMHAWAEVQEKYPDRAWWRRKSTMRGLMWEHAVDRVMGVVSEDKGLAAVQHYDTASFIADDIVFFRLKKADPKLFSSNFPTPLAQMFHRHETADLFGHQGFQRVEIVHTFNAYLTSIDWIGVVARDGKKVIWDYELRRGDGAIVLPFPVAPTLPAGKTVVKPNLPDTGNEGKEATENEAKE